MKRLVITAIILIMGLSACSNNAHTSDEVIDMTDQEKNLLCENFVDEDRIREGQLNAAQKAALDELRAGTELLDRKYPDLEYKVTRLTPATKLVGRGSLTITCPYDENEYDVFINRADDGFHLTETVYGYVLRDRFDNYIKNLFIEKNINGCCYTNFASEVGEEIDANTTAEELIALGKENARYTDIFLEDTGDRDVTVIKQMLLEENIMGIYHIFFVENVNCLSVDDLEKDRSRYEKVSFEI